MRLVSIASGSEGNCALIENDDTAILIDCGISGKRIESGLEALGHSVSDISAILISHEHIDHIAGLGVISRKYNIPIYSGNGTIQEIRYSKKVGDIDKELFTIVRSECMVDIGSLKVMPFAVSHDAAEPLMYRVYDGSASNWQERSLAVATDLGMADSFLVSMLRGVNGLILEANHDVKMLELGPYPYKTKQRILSNRGHISNETSGKLLAAIMHDDLKAVLLGHLSKTNNYPELAYETVKLELDMAPVRYMSSDVFIATAPPDRLSDIIEI